MLIREYREMVQRMLVEEGLATSNDVGELMNRFDKDIRDCFHNGELPSFAIEKINRKVKKAPGKKLDLAEITVLIAGMEASIGNLLEEVSLRGWSNNPVDQTIIANITGILHAVKASLALARRWPR